MYAYNINKQIYHILLFDYIYIYTCFEKIININIYVIIFYLTHKDLVTLVTF